MHDDKASSRDLVLVVDDDAGFARTLGILLEDEGYGSAMAHSGRDALTILERRPGTSLVVCDLAMPGMSGLELLSQVRGLWPRLPVIMMTAHSSVDTAVRAIQLGAFQYLTKPIEPAELLVQAARAIAQARLATAHDELRARAGDPGRFDVLVGSSASMVTVRTMIERVAAVDSTVLVRGETGTGKELVARLIHTTGPRARGPFVVVNCTAIPGELLESELFGHDRGAFTGAIASRPGRIELADGGTLLLDEVGDMPPQLQPKLLRFLQDRRVQRVGATRERTVDVRILAATHCALEQAIADGTFREDLFHRLATIPLVVPPLRERREDLPELCHHLLAKIALRLGRPVPWLTPAAAAELAARPFTGNVRELENVLERAIVLGPPGAVEIASIDAPLAPPATTVAAAWEPPLEGGYSALQQRYRDSEMALIRRALAAWGSASNSIIADRLGTQRRVLERRMKDYGLSKDG